MHRIGDILHLHTFQIVHGYAVALTVGQLVSDSAGQDTLHPLALGPVIGAVPIERIRDEITVLIIQKHPLTPHDNARPSDADVRRSSADHDRSRGKL